MRYLDAEAVGNIATGAALLGTGGGGDPYIGKMMALPVTEENGPVKLVSPEEIAAEDFFLPTAMMGAPSVAIEKFPKGDESVRVFEKLGEYLDQETIAGAFPMEAGGVNSMTPIAVVVRLGTPLADCDSMGRTFPELPMVTFHPNGILATPVTITDEKGNIGIMETIDNTWTERLARAQTVKMGASALVSTYPVTGRQLQDYGIHNIVTLSEGIDKVIRGTYVDEQEKRQASVEVTDGLELFQRKILDVEREAKGSFNLGRIKLSGLNSDAGSEAVVHFQNENLIAEKDGQVITMMPDLICMVDLETLTPVTTESLKYGKRVQVMGLKANATRRMKKGTEAVGPRYLGYEMDYQPLENSVAKEDK